MRWHEGYQIRGIRNGEYLVDSYGLWDTRRKWLYGDDADSSVAALYPSEEAAEADLPLAEMANTLGLAIEVVSISIGDVVLLPEQSSASL